MNTKINRREFMKRTAGAAAGLSAIAGRSPVRHASEEPLFKISLAEWSLVRKLFGGEMDHLDFAAQARAHGIEAVEYVNQFFMDKATDAAYLSEMKDRADGEGVVSVLIMCDREGRLGAAEESERVQTVENHKKWVEAARTLGCHAIRVNGYADGTFEEQQQRAADGLSRLCEFADDFDIGVIIENHGGFSSNGSWLVGVIEQADHPRAGTLPDFGNFRIDEETSYDSYQGVRELMPYAQGVSVKPRVWDAEGGQHDLEYTRMMRIVLEAGYRGYCGIEYGPEGRQWEGIAEVRSRLIEAREALADEFG